MGLVTCNGSDVVGCRVSLPRIGAWSAVLTAEKVEPITGAVEIKLGSLTLKGTIRGGAVYLSANALMVVGGAAQLGKMARAKFYKATTRKQVLSDLLRDAGETLDSTSTGLDVALPFWTTTATETGKAVRTLLGSSAWRILSSGSLWTGAESWPACSGSYEIVGEQPEEGHVEIGMSDPCILPGQSLADGRHVDRVEYDLDGSHVRARVWF